MKVNTINYSCEVIALGKTRGNSAGWRRGRETKGKQRKRMLRMIKRAQHDVSR